MNGLFFALVFGVIFYGPETFSATHVNPVEESTIHPPSISFPVISSAEYGMPFRVCMFCQFNIPRETFDSTNHDGREVANIFNPDSANTLFGIIDYKLPNVNINDGKAGAFICFALSLTSTPEQDSGQQQLASEQQKKNGKKRWGQKRS